MLLRLDGVSRAIADRTLHRDVSFGVARALHADREQAAEEQEEA